MIRRLIILLLIVGCEESNEDNYSPIGLTYTISSAIIYNSEYCSDLGTESVSLFEGVSYTFTEDSLYQFTPGYCYALSIVTQEECETEGNHWSSSNTESDAYTIDGNIITIYDDGYGCSNEIWSLTSSTTAIREQTVGGCSDCISENEEECEANNTSFWDCFIDGEFDSECLILNIWFDYICWHVEYISDN